MSLVEQILQRFAADTVKQGRIVRIRPHYCMTHDNSGAVINKFNALKSKQPKLSIYKPSQLVFTLDHDVQNIKNQFKYGNIKKFAKTHGIDFYPAGRGIGHQINIEEGYAFPNKLTVASDSHSNMYGGIGCLGTPIVRSDALSIWCTGETWLKVPPVIKVNLLNQLPEGVSGKDVIIALCGYFNADQVLNSFLEFSTNSLGVEDRLSIANMTTEWGALAGVFPYDSITESYLKNLYEKSDKMKPRNLNKIKHISTKNANYFKTLTIDLSTLRPFVSGPNSVKIFTSAKSLENDKIKINKAYLVSCTNSRTSDIHEAAKILKNKKIYKNVEMYISAASSKIEQESKLNGDWDTLLQAGCIPLISGCGPCIGLGQGLLKSNEVGISATNRNYKGRMGDPNALCYLASPAVVATSALNGYISSNSNLSDIPISAQIQTQSTPSTSFELEDGIETNGTLFYCKQDNINTDAIYPGKYTYNDDITPNQMKNIVMENYDLQFTNLVSQHQNTKYLIAGYNFGTGSSREQAATALLSIGIKIVFAGSFSETFKRNALNNGLLTIELPELVDYLQSKSYPNLTHEIGHVIFHSGGKLILNDKVFKCMPLNGIAKELVESGGIESFILNKIEK
eukprot:NODE_45_length_32908_cov_0.790271.p4 type:complete len:624 gc:universal NODE_45_length_32908_cov_0.790271:18326-20197(+)